MPGCGLAGLLGLASVISDGGAGGCMVTRTISTDVE